MGNSEKSDWIVRESKSRPGHKYNFNTATGETRWCTEMMKEKTTELPMVKPRTPAQDRLKRLQHTLKKEGKAKKESKEKNKNLSEKRRNEETRPSDLRKTPTKLTKKPRLESPTKSNSQKTEESLPKAEKCKEKESSTAVHFVKKIKEICKTTFNTFNTKDSSQPKRLLPSIKKTSSFKIPKKSKPELKPEAVQLALQELQQGSETKRERKLVKPLTENIPKSTTVTLPNTPTNLVIPEYTRGSANARLARLKRSFQLQPTSSSANCTASLTPAKSLEATAAPNEPNTSNRCNPLQDTRSDITNATQTDEPMDWQPIEETASNCDEEPPTKQTTPPADSTISEYYDAVNENLWRFDADKRLNARSAKKMWLRDHYYFVLDTNVLLKNLAFIDDLSKMRLCNTTGTILYIPYQVLQELDKLKLRSLSESTRLQTGRVIRYLNAKFEAKTKHIKAQSALDSRDHSIEIDSPDDSIINCCLQVQQHVSNVILLTEDVNLRNKAICNNLLVSTKSDLVSKHAERPGGDE